MKCLLRSSLSFFLLLSSVSVLAEPEIPHDIRPSLSVIKGSRLFSSKKITTEVLPYLSEFKRKSEHDFNIARFDEAYNRDARSTGNIILDLAVVVWAEERSDKKDLLQVWCSKAISKENWGNNHDLEISHLLFALAIVYDWHRDKLDPALRKNMKDFIYRHAKEEYNFAKDSRANWWANSYWQNHCWINYTAILASGLALSSEEPETADWVQFSYEKIEKAVSLLSSDGSNHEGLNYSIYGNLWLIRAMSLIEPFDPDIFKRSAYLKNYSRYFMAYMTSGKLNNFFDTGDSPRSLWYNPAEIFLKLSTEYGDENARTLYGQYMSHLLSPRAGVFLSVYGYEPPKEEKLELSKSYFSEDLGLFIGKHLEKDDVTESFLFKSGIPGGMNAHGISGSQEEHPLNRSHEHPDQNSFIIWTKDGFLISDTGYTDLKLSIDHNTLLVNDKGQLGEGEQWFRDAAVNEKTFTGNAGFFAANLYSDENVSVVSAEAAEFYPAEVGLKKFNRSIIWIRTVGFLIYDQVETAKPETLSILFHSDFKIVDEQDRTFDLIDGHKKVGEITSLYPTTADRRISNHEVLSHDDKKMVPKGMMLRLDQIMTGTRGAFITFICQGNQATQVSISESENSYKVDIQGHDGSYQVTLNRYSGFKASLLKDGNEVLWSTNEK